MRFPDLAQETALHRRMIAGDPLATPDVAEVYMRPLSDAVCGDMRCDQDIAHDASIDALLHYFEHADDFEPKRGRLATYLMDIAKKRAIDRLRSTGRQAGRNEKYGEVVELQPAAPKEAMENHAEAAKLWDRIEEALPDERDRAAVRLIIDRDRSTDALAAALELPPMPDDELRAATKRHRDRLVKVLERIGEKLDGGDE